MTEVRVRTFVKDSVILSASNAGARLVNFLLLPVYTAALAPEVYGITDLSLNLAFLLAAVLSLQMQWGLQSFFPDEPGDAYRSRLVSTAFAYFVAAAAAALLLASLSKPLSTLLLGDRAHWRVMALGLAYTSVTLIAMPLDVATRMRGRMRRLAAINCVNALSVALMTLAAIFLLHLGENSIAFANLVGISVLAALFLADNAPLISPGAVDLALMKKMARVSAPVVLSAVLVWVNGFGDRYVIGLSRSQAEVGLYGIANRLALAIGVFVWGIVSAYAPFASANAQDPACRPRFLLSFDLTAMFLALACFSVSAFSREIIALMTAPEYHGAFVAVPFLLYGTALYYLGLLVGYSFVIRKNGGYCLLANLACGASNLGLNLALVPRYGFMAAAVTTLASYALFLAISLFLGARVFPCGYDVGRLLLVTFIPGAAVVPLSMSGGLLLKCLAVAAVAAFIAVVYSGRVAALVTGGRDWLVRKGFGAFHG